MRDWIRESLKAELGDSWEAQIERSPLGRRRLESLLERVFRAGLEKQETEERRSNLYFQQLMELLPDYVYFKDLNSRFLSVNPAHARHIGVANPKDVIGKSDFDFFQKQYAQAKFEDEQEIIRTGIGFLFREEHHLLQSGEEQWSLTTKLPLYDESGVIQGTFGLSRNITDSKRAELELERQKSLLATIVEILPCRVFVRDREGRYLLINKEYRKWIHVDSETPVVGRTIQEFLNDDKVPRITAEDEQIISTGESIINQVRFDESPLQRERWILTSKVPLRDRNDEIEGLVGMTLDITEQKEAEHRAQVAQTALLQKNQQIEAELLVARQLQERLLSEGFQGDGSFSRRGARWQLKAHYLYKPSHHLAGDFFFLLPFDENRIGVIICDVMGHGVKAALVTTLIRGLLLEIPGVLDDPAAVLHFLNDKLHGLAQKSYFPRFVTAVYAVVDLESAQLRIASAGHPAPIISRYECGLVDARRLPLLDTGVALGLQAESTYTETELVIESPVQLLFFTDGIIEFENQTGEEFGLERLQQAVTAAGESGPDVTNREVEAALLKFGGGREQADDVCQVTLQLSLVD